MTLDRYDAFQFTNPIKNTQYAALYASGHIWVFSHTQIQTSRLEFCF
jgi:hypothetical protein